MKTVAIMQPYLFPYIGYFQLIALSDVFVIHDDVQYIKGGWINRNRFLLNGAAQFVTLSVAKAPSYLKINERHFTEDLLQNVRSLLRFTDAAYRKAPHYLAVRQLLNKCLTRSETNVSTFVTMTITAVCDFLDVRTPIVLSSKLEKDDTLAGEPRVVEIASRLGATVYVNPPGGADLYSPATFHSGNIELRFLRPTLTPYRQFGGEFVPWLSIIDVLMFNAPDEVRAMLECYVLE